jgi:hypothetical protein
MFHGLFVLSGSPAADESVRASSRMLDLNGALLDAGQPRGGWFLLGLLSQNEPGRTRKIEET